MPVVFPWQSALQPAYQFRVVLYISYYKWYIFSNISGISENVIRIKYTVRSKTLIFYVVINTDFSRFTLKPRGRSKKITVFFAVDGLPLVKFVV